MAFGRDIQRAIQVLVDHELSSAEAHAFVAEVARTELAHAVRDGFGRNFAQTVDGVLGAREEDAKLNGGEIIYFFTNLVEAVTFALNFLQGISPRGKTGQFSQAWFLIVNGRPWQGAIKDIPRGAQIMISNYAPFARHLEVGWKNRRAGLFMTEKARQAVRRQFPGVRADRIFINIPGRPGASIGGWPVPYIGRGGPVLYPALALSEG